MDRIDLYVLCYKHKEREKRMRERFRSLGIPARFKIFESDPPSMDQFEGSKAVKRILSCSLNHILMIRDFYENSDKQFGIFCEDDVHVSKDFKAEIGSICRNFIDLKVAVLMLGYLINFNPAENQGLHTLLKHDRRKYYSYGAEQWGTQCYMLTRTYAKYLLETITMEAVREGDNIAADWRITKDWSGALIYPPLFVEENSRICGDVGQDRYHTSCNQFLYDKEAFTE